MLRFWIADGGNRNGAGGAAGPRDRRGAAPLGGDGAGDENEVEQTQN